MGDTEIDLRGVFGLLARQIRLIAITFVLVLVVAGFVAFSLTPTYSTNALVMVDPSRKNLLDPESQMSTSTSDSLRIDSEVEILRSDNILLKVIAAEGLASDPNLGVSLSLRERVMTFLGLTEVKAPTAQTAINQALNNLRSAVSIQRRGLTYLIAVQARSPDPQQAADLANAVARQYIAAQIESKVASTLASRDILQARINQARQAIVSSEGTLDTFIDDNIAQISQSSGRSDIVAMQRQIEQLAAARTNNAQLAQEVQAGLVDRNWQSVVSTVGSSALAELERQRLELAAQLASSQTDSPVMVDLRAQIAEIEGRLETETAREVSNLQQSVTQSEAQETELRRSLRTTVVSSNLSADILTRIYELQQNAELARSQYQTLLERTQDLVAQADLQVADSRVVSEALAPETPSFPNRSLILAIAGIIGLGLGVALAFLYENYIGGFTSEAQLGSVLRTRVATAVPRQRTKSEKESLANVMVTAPLSVFAESIRRLKATLEQSIRQSGKASVEGEGKLIMVSSTAPNEGKTTLALALARSYAIAGQRVMLIDCDLRKPSLHRHLNIDPAQGLQEFLDNENTAITSALSRDTLTDLTLIVGARRSSLPTDQFLTSPSFANLLAAARKSYNIVIIDTPPVGPVVDGLYIAPHADAIVFVTRWAATSQIDAKHAVESLSAVKDKDTEIIAVINQQNQTKASYMRKYGGYYAEVSY